MARLPFPESTITGVYGSMSEFRRKNGLQAHSGTDFAPNGSNKGKTAVPAVGNGTVKLVQWSAVLGWVVVQTVWDVRKKKAAYVGYCHMSCKAHGVNCKGGHDASLALDLKVGQKLTEGQSVGIMGNTGSATSGVHLHLTISWTVKGVFGATSDKFDFVEWVKEQAGPAPKAVAKPATPKVAAKPAAKVTEKTVTVFACPHCKKELK
jgi:murein DD-endopeptidase MepM/ murein hydrolase activator NlpD